MGGVLLDGHVGPVEGASAEKHVPDEGFNRGFTYEAHEEELLDDLRRDGAQ